MTNPSFISSMFDNFRWFGAAGALIVILASCISGLLYRGKQGERFSIFNHFISELGEVGVSQAAPLFNIGLFLGGLTLIPFCITLGLRIPHWLAYLGMAAGVWAGASCALVGVFPMNNIKAHSRVAMSYFRSGLVMVFFFTLAIIFQPATGRVLPLAAVVPGVLAFASFAGFLSIPWKTDEELTSE